MKNARANEKLMKFMNVKVDPSWLITETKIS